MILILLQMLFFPLLLIVNGEPARFFLLRHLKLFSDLDLVQICILDVYLGGLILYVIAILPFMFFNQFLIIGLTAFCFVLSTFIHSRALGQVTRFNTIKASLKENRHILFDYMPLFAMFIILLLIDLSASSGLVFGGIFDESIHSLRTEVIVENNQMGLTLQPYLPAGNIYPEASHVIFAFAHYVLNIMVPKAVFYVTILFKALSVFGAYFLGKKLSSKREFYLGLSFVFTFISSWPLFVVWGGNPFLVGFPLFLVCLGLLFSLIHSQAKTSLAELVAAGLLFGLAGAIIVSYLETLMMVAAIVSIYWLARNPNSLRHRVLEFIVIFSVGLLVLSPFLFRFFVFYQYPGHNIGIPTDFVGYPKQVQISITQTLQWALDNLSPYFELRLFMLLLFVGLGILVWINRKFNNIKFVLAFASSIFLAPVALSFIAFFLPGDFAIVSWGHQGILIVISLNIFILAFCLELAQLLRSRKLRWLSNLSSKIPRANKMLTVTILVLIVTPFVYHRILTDPNAISGTYSMFAVTTQDDYKLMTWMEGNVPSDAVILVSLYESGLYIPVISHHRIVFPYSASSFSRSYQTVLDSLDDNVLNKTVYDSILNLNISHVYVGSNSAYWEFKQHKWNPELFLGNPNFKLVKNFGNAYLFKFNYTNPNAVFMDDFEHEQWDDYGWQTYFDGNGVGNVTIQNGFEDDSRCLKITSQAVYTVSTWRYACYVTREIFAQENSDVTLSFRLNAPESFIGNDTFAVLISNIYRNQSLIITTPNGIYQGYAHTQVLNASERRFEFDLTSLWHQYFNSTLPTTLVMELVNYDFHGIENVVYVGDITVTCTPVPIASDG